MFMPIFLIEFLYVLTRSKKTQWCLAVGFIGFLTINLLGYHTTANLELFGPLSIMTDSIREKLNCRYDRAAHSCLVGFAILAYKAYKKDKKRFL